MDALIHERTTTVQSPGAFPPGGVVVALLAPPGAYGAREGQASEARRLDGALEHARGFAVAGVEYSSQKRTRMPVCGDHLVDGAQPDVHGLFDDAVLAGCGCFHHGLVMQAAGRRHGNDVDIVTGNEDIEVVRARRIQLRCDLPATPAAVIHDASGLRAGKPAVCRQVNRGDHAAADDAESMGHRSASSRERASSS